MWKAMLADPSKAQTPTPASIASPWSTGNLASWVWADIFGADDIPVTREQCMAIPAVARARHLIAGTISQLPLGLWRGETQLDAAPWMYRTNGAVPPQLRMLWTMDDLIFGGLSLWAVERGTEKQILDAWRVPPEWWEITQEGQILYNGDSVTQESVVLIHGPFEGLLEAGAHTVRAFHNLERAWAKRVRQPIPAVELHETEADQLEDEEVNDLLEQWGKMLESGGGAAFTPYDIDLRTHGEAKTDLFIEGRNAATLDIARLLNVPATMLDASLATSSLQYNTKADDRNAYIDQTIRFWAMAIEARLSMDDVVPRGQRVAFDLTSLVSVPNPPTGPATED